MEGIAVAHGLGGVSPECCDMLSKILDVYLKKLIKASIGTTDDKAVAVCCINNMLSLIF